MSWKPAAAVENPQDEMAALVCELYATHHRLQELAGGEVDAILLPSGHSYLLHDAQEKLRESEAAWQESQQTLQLTLDAARLGHWDRDLVTQAAHRSLRHDQIFGYEEQLPEWSYERFLAHVHPDDRERVGRQYQAGVTAQTEWDFECRIMRGDGALRWIWVHGNVITNAAQESIKMLGMVGDITERKLAEQAAGMLAAIVDSSSDAIVGKDLHGIVTSWNGGAEKIFGYAAGEMIGRSITLLIPPDRQDDEERIQARIRRQESVEHFETVRMRKDGTLVDVSVSVSPIKDATGRIVGASKVARDITARKRAEEALQASEALYRTLFENAPDGIVIADPESYYLDANASICRMLGFPRGELIGLHASDIVVPAEIEHIGPALSAIKATSDYHREWQFRRKDGSVFAAEVIATTMPDGNLLGMIRDITERRNAELALREKELLLYAADRRLAEIVNGMTEACFALDEEWHFTFVNDRGETLLRHHREQMLGRTIWEVFSKLVGTPMEANYRRAMTERVPVAFEVFSPIAERWLDIRLFPTPEGLAAFLLDIHARKQSEEALHETQARLNSTLAAGSIGTWTWDLIHDRQVADEFTARMFSIEPDAAAKGLPADVYLHAVLKEDQPAVAAALARAVRSCESYDIEYRVPQPDGAVRWLHAKGRVEADAAGHPLHFHGASMDITERKRIEGRFRRLVDSNAQGVIFWNTKGEITQANEAFLRIVGYTREDLEAGRIGWTAMTPPEYADLDRRSLEELAARGVCPPFEKEFIRKDGSRVPIFIGAATFEDSPDEGVCFVLDITESKAAKDALDRERNLLRLLIDNLPACIYVKDLEGRYLVFNAASVRQVGLNSEAEAFGKTGFDFFPPEIARLYEADDQQVLISGQTITDREEPTQDCEGNRLWYLTTKLPLRDGSGVIGLLGISQDITERKRAEEALRESEELFSAAFRSSPAAVSIIRRRDLIYLEVNEAFLRLFECTREQTIGHTVLETGLVAPKTIELIRDRVSASGSLLHEEMEFRTHRGARLDVNLSAKEIQLHGEACTLSILIDITERKRTEQALRESEAHFHFLNDLSEATRTLADSAQIMAVTARMLGEHLRASRCAYADVEKDGDRFAILHDYTDGCASTVGHYELSLFGPRAVATLDRGKTLIIRNVGTELLPGEGGDMFSAIGIQAIITCPLVKEGVLRAMMAVHQTTPRDWQPGEITIVQDVVERCWATIERRTAEAKIHQINAQLEQRVTQRTAQFEAANKELEAFSYSVSHDLRAPLRTVDGFAQAVLEDYGPLLPDEGKRHLRTIREGAQRMGRLIDDLLTFSQLGRLPLKRQTVDAGRQVRETLEELQAGQGERALEIRLGPLPPCQGDPALLKQVWLNLLSNALKYTTRREHAVVEIGATREPGATVYFVRDNGSGFDPRYAGKLFGVFQRLHRQEEFEGTGVGLAIVQRIVHRHGGRIWADAAVDRGATFYFTLEGETEL
ncbi:MAG: hypothetical protein QOE70_1788 [Chthoniobacter sp.]|jgi:PAS domain S-box-containing protein|nr:hypothetical protein [Chthoniobacter sp.]